MVMTYKLEQFEGPLDLLLHLIDQAEIDIHDISISDITDQYMNFIRAMQELELDVTSEFLVMAASLLAMKSRLLLPKPPQVESEATNEPELDPREELIARLIEYRKYKQASEQLRLLEQERAMVYTKEPEDLTPYLPENFATRVEGLQMSQLMQAFQKAMRKFERRAIVATVQKDEITVNERIRQLIAVLRTTEMVRFTSLLADELNRHEIVVTFLALLELMKQKKIRCYQHRLFDEIVVQWRGDVADDGTTTVKDSD